jgi:1,4-alpha-glucan branching enzyme
VTEIKLKEQEEQEKTSPGRGRPVQDLQKVIKLFLLQKEEGLQDPHQFLGLSTVKLLDSKKKKCIRLWRPGAKELFLEVEKQIVSARQVDSSGLFEVSVKDHVSPFDYRIFNQDGTLQFDPYVFLPTCSDLDVYLFKKGVHYEVYHFLGAHKVIHQGVEGVKFLLWAPDASGVSVVGDFNRWDGRLFPMRNLFSSGIWEIFIPGLQEGEKYKYEIRTKKNEILLKSDPYAFYQEVRPCTASRVFDVTSYQWKDEAWCKKRKEETLNRPINVYEVHLGSWKKRDGKFLSHEEMAKELSSYCRDMGYTHVELLPIMEHPLDESWGYQVTGFYAATSRYGTPREFQGFVDVLHQEGVGVILDWVPAHFPDDSFSLEMFDGKALYEYDDPKKAKHPHWSTKIFNYGRKEVANFLLGSALFWIDLMHVDGLRVDAVASMLYLDYGRKFGEWEANEYGGNHNLEAIEFLKHLNSIVQQKFPDRLMIAEESSSFTGVTHPLEENGLGFSLKWNMGWMNDTLSYFSKDPIYRKFYQNHLTFSLFYAFSEKFILVLSHDEVVHEKGSLLNKMPGDLWQKIANLKLLYSYSLCHPGKKLFFMGTELAGFDEWDESKELNWTLLDDPMREKFHQFIKDSNHFYLKERALWERDFHWDGFSWVSFLDSDSGVISYLRKAKDRDLFCLHHFTPIVRENYFFPLSHLRSIQEIFSSDYADYGGSGVKNEKKNIILKKNEEGEVIGFFATLAPLSTQIFEVQFE